MLRTKSADVRGRGPGGVLFWSLGGDTAGGELITAVDRGLHGR
ncbi:hypothetical protein ACFV7Q_37815 [Streptomyces sp. NPDC059851]